MRIRSIIGLAFGACISGCMQGSFTSDINGALISDTAMQQLPALATDQDWVRFRYGEPDEIMMGEGQEKWIYRYRQTHRRNELGATMEWYERDQTITFTRDGALISATAAERESDGWDTRRSK